MHNFRTTTITNAIFEPQYVNGKMFNQKFDRKYERCCNISAYHILLIFLYSCFESCKSIANYCWVKANINTLSEEILFQLHNLTSPRHNLTHKRADYTAELSRQKLRCKWLMSNKKSIKNTVTNVTLFSSSMNIV